jgi:hypothetical protein
MRDAWKSILAGVLGEAALPVGLRVRRLEMPGKLIITIPNSAVAGDNLFYCTIPNNWTLPALIRGSVTPVALVSRSGCQLGNLVDFQYWNAGHADGALCTWLNRLEVIVFEFAEVHDVRHRGNLPHRRGLNSLIAFLYETAWA